MSAQRAHQNTMEFLLMYIPMLILAGLFDARQAAMAGGITLVGRVLYIVGYSMAPAMRNMGYVGAIGTIYTMYILIVTGYRLCHDLLPFSLPIPIE